MPGHEFENKVQQQMEELHLPPSDSVWNRVEQEIRKEKRRRRILFLLPVFLLLGIGGYLALQKSTTPAAVNTDKKIENDTKNSVSDPVAVVIPPASNSEQSSSGKDNIKSDETTTASPKSEGSNPLVAADKKSDPAAANNSTRVDKLTVAKNDKHSIKVGSSKPEKKGKKQKAVLAVGIKETPEMNQVTKTSEKPVATKSEQSLAPVTDSATAIVTTEPTAIVPANQDSIIVNKNNAVDSIAPVQAKKSSKQAQTWQWGFTGGLGVSKLAEGGLFSAFDKSLMMDAAYNNNSGTPPLPTSSSTGPSSVEPGFNWNAGVFVQRKINERVQVSGAIIYNYFSTQSHIGAKVDSSRLINNFSSTSVQVDAFYRNGGTTDFTSQYHFIELPLTLHLQLNKNKKTPFYWNAGLSIAQLVSTEALHYDGSSGVYYKDDELFRKTQFGFHTGLSIKLFTQSFHPLELGPHFNYQFTNLLKPKDSDARHLLSGSLLIRWYMKK